MGGPHRRNSQACDDGGGGGGDDGEENVSFDPINGPWSCGVPKGQTCLYDSGCNSGATRTAEIVKITRKDVANLDAVKISCSNEHCPVSPFMHLACFASFEESIMSYLKAHGRSRGWSDKQRAQNLWTKRGYDLIFKACECNCEHGFVRKDLDWVPRWNDDANEEVSGVRRKRKRSKNQNKPTLTIGLHAFAASSGSHHAHPSDPSNNLSAPSQGGSNHQETTTNRTDVQTVPLRNRANSMSSNTSSGSSFASCSPLDVLSASPGSTEGISTQQPPRRFLLKDRTRHDSGGSIFQRRSDYSSFNVLPRHKINSYHIKMEDECSIGNDETRIFILSNYASNKMNKVPCVLCKNLMHIFDRYPLIDGTFFLSPRQHAKTCIQVKAEGKTSFLTAICIACLEGWTGNGIVCRFCFKSWTGDHLVLGTMYSYDIFAAMPCCPERFQCNNCGQLVCHPDQPFNFFSDYSQMVSCPHCGVQDAHFAKSLAVYTSRDEANKQIQLAQNLQQQLNLQQQQQQHVPSGLRVHRVNSA